jgi:hypothetical protein
MDRNGDGKINDGTELFGLATVVDGHRAGDGYTAMRAEDSNHDGKLTAADAHFAELKVWVDTNSNGVSDAGELRDLSSLGIIELDLNAHASTEMNNGNLLGLVSGYKTADGQNHAMADVWFAKDQHAADTTAASSNGTTGTRPRTPRQPRQAPQPTNRRLFPRQRPTPPPWPRPTQRPCSTQSTPPGCWTKPIRTPR